jgi:ArsR family transcriptional regulator
MPVAELLPVTDVSATACCGPLSQETIGATEAEAVARAFKALGDPTRVRILSIVASHPDQEACVCDLQEPLELSQPTVSHHLKVLMDAGFLTRSKRGTWAYYALVPGSLDSVAGILSGSRIPSRVPR